MLLDVCENRAGHAALSPLSRKPACIVRRYKIESEFLIPKTLKGSPQCTRAVGRRRGAWSSPELAPAWFWVQPSLFLGGLHPTHPSQGTLLHVPPAACTPLGFQHSAGTRASQLKARPASPELQHTWLWLGNSWLTIGDLISTGIPPKDTRTHPGEGVLWAGRQLTPLLLTPVADSPGVNHGTNPAPRRCCCCSALPATAAPTRAPCGMRAGTELRWMRSEETDPPSHLVGTPRSPRGWCRDHQDLLQQLPACRC